VQLDRLISKLASNLEGSSKMKNIRSLSLLLVTAVLLATYSGCNSIGANKLADSAERFNPFKRLNSKEEKEPEYQTPKSMVAIWKASTLQQAGTKSIRGFGGRFYFYDANNDVVRVKGDLTIYGTATLASPP